MPITASVLLPFQLNETAFSVGDTFVQPEGYPDLYVIDLFAEGKIGSFDINLLPPELQAIMADPNQLARRRCPTCG